MLGFFSYEQQGFKLKKLWYNYSTKMYLCNIKKSILYVLAGSSFIIIFAVLLNPIFANAQANEIDVVEKREALQKELELVEQEIEGQRVLLNNKQRERVSIERDVSILDAKIKKEQLEIRSRNLVIDGLEDDIFGKQKTIGGLDLKLEREKESLAQLIRKTNEIDDYSLVEIVLATEDISDFFVDLEAFDSIQKSLNESFREIETTKDVTEDQKGQLEDKRGEELELRQIQVLQKAQIEEQEREKQRILDITKGVEAEYQKVLDSKQRTAAEIRTALFRLRGSAAIPFEKALKYANEAHEITGVRPALLLGTFKQETNLGENVGQCVITNEPNKGDGKGINTGRYFSGVMKATRDVDPFMDIVNKLGINPYSQVVSCPPSYGYGGAMGPAQFIPSTWILYEDRIGRASGQVPPNPWDPRTAFIASALLLSDNGADRGTYYAERLAALRYFAGWKNAEKSSYAFYGDQVMELAAEMQELIDVLGGS